MILSPIETYSFPAKVMVISFFSVCRNLFDKMFTFLSYGLLPALFQMVSNMPTAVVKALEIIRETEDLPVLTQA
jgi:hypothetical protein